MASKELIEKVAAKIDPEIWASHLPVPTRYDVETFHSHRQKSTEIAKDILPTILADLQEPTEAMLEECSDAWRYGQVLWPKMLAASALGEQSE